MRYNRISDLRNDNDWSQQHVANLLFMCRSTYSSYETGARTMSPDVLTKLSQLYNTSIDYLLGLTDVKEPYPKGKDAQKEVMPILD